MVKSFFHPSYLINYLIKKLIKSYSFKNLNILDFGCGDQPYKDSFENNNYYPFDVNTKKKIKYKNKIRCYIYDFCSLSNSKP